MELPRHMLIPILTYDMTAINSHTNKKLHQINDYRFYFVKQQLKKNRFINILGLCVVSAVQSLCMSTIEKIPVQKF